MRSLALTVTTVKAFHYRNHYYSTYSKGGGGGRIHRLKSPTTPLHTIVAFYFVTLAGILFCNPHPKMSFHPPPSSTSRARRGGVCWKEGQGSLKGYHIQPAEYSLYPSTLYLLWLLEDYYLSRETHSDSALHPEWPPPPSRRRWIKIWETSNLQRAPWIQAAANMKAGSGPPPSMTPSPASLLPPLLLPPPPHTHPSEARQPPDKGWFVMIGEVCTHCMCVWVNTADSDITPPVGERSHESEQTRSHTHSYTHTHLYTEHLHPFSLWVKREADMRSGDHEVRGSGGGVSVELRVP